MRSIRPPRPHTILPLLILFHNPPFLLIFFLCNMHINSAPNIVERILNSLHQDAEAFKTILQVYTSPGSPGDSLHVQAMEYAKLGDDNEQEMICPALFIVEKTMQEIGFISVHDFPTKAVDRKDPFAKKYSHHDLVLVLTLLSFSMVHARVLKLPDVYRPSRSKRLHVDAPSQEYIDHKNKVRKDAQSNNVRVHELRRLYANIEARMLEDLVEFHTSVKENPQDMIMFSESRIEVFNRLPQTTKTSSTSLIADEGVVQDGDALAQSRKRVAAFMLGDDED